MADDLTVNLDLIIPTDHDEDGAEVWGLKINSNLHVLDAAIRSHNFAADTDNHDGLNFAYKSGIVRFGNIISFTPAGEILLIDDSTNYIEVNPEDGLISANIVEFSKKRIPLFEVVTVSGEITNVIDSRAFFTVEPVNVLTAKGDLLVYDGNLYKRLPIGLNGEVLISDSDEENGIKWGGITRGIAFYIAGPIVVETQAMSFIAPCDLTLLDVVSAVDIAPTGSDLILDIHKNDETVFTTQENRPTITAGTTSNTSVTPDITSIKAGDKITLEIDQKGSIISSSNLSVTVRCVTKAS